jgi:hypothetical protein
MTVNYKEKFDRDGYVVIDDFIDIDFQLEIKNKLINVQFPWYYQKDSTLQEDAAGSTFPILSHLMKSYGKIESYYSTEFDVLGERAAYFVGKDFKENDLIRGYLQLPLSEPFVKNPLNVFHIDWTEKHLVLLYYVNDSDGDTILSSVKYDGEQFKYTFTEDNVMARISPKQGRALIFDGNYYHTTTQCRDNIRCVLNYNII